MAELFPDAVKKAAFVFADFPATRETRDKYEAAFPEAGWAFEDCDQIYNIAGESDWKPFASNLQGLRRRDGRVGRVRRTRTSRTSSPRRSRSGSSRRRGSPTRTSTTAGFAEWNGQNGGAGDNVYVRMAAVPFELADEVPAVQQYLDIVEESGGTPGPARRAVDLGVPALGDGRQGVRLRASPPSACSTRRRPRTGWTAGGLHSETDPGSNEAAACGMLLKLERRRRGTKVAPEDELFDCDRRSTSSRTSAPLRSPRRSSNADRVATQYGTFTPS